MLRRIFAVIFIFTASLCAQISDLRPTVLLVSIDGFRYDYFGKTSTPNLDSIMDRGVRARYMIPSFPTKTFPNHYTIVTGLYPAHHGIIANNMWDDSIHAQFKMSDRKQVQDARWWGGEPIWVTAQKAGQKTAPFYWPGSEAAEEGILPTYNEPYDDKHRTSYEYRVNRILSWLDLPVDQRPTFLTLYFEDVDEKGHDYGPDSPQLLAAIGEVDTALGHLLDGLRSRKIDDRINIIVLSDHGMAACSRDRVLMMDDYVKESDVIVVDTNPVLAVKAKDGNNAALVDQLKRAPHLTVYTPDTVPKRLHFSDNSRITPVIAVADTGWKISSNADTAKHPNRKYGGDHGYDNAAPEMRAIFVAAGPAFKSHRTIDAFPNIDVYDLLSHLLNVRPAANDGTIKPFLSVLQRSPSKSRAQSASTGH
jgi:predicted AlkP superfamily pyrophosphatase or phosphodiesterase